MKTVVLIAAILSHSALAQLTTVGNVPLWEDYKKQYLIDYSPSVYYWTPSDPIKMADINADILNDADDQPLASFFKVHEQCAPLGQYFCTSTSTSPCCTNGQQITDEKIYWAFIQDFSLPKTGLISIKIPRKPVFLKIRSELKIDLDILTPNLEMYYNVQRTCKTLTTYSECQVDVYPEAEAVIVLRIDRFETKTAAESRINVYAALTAGEIQRFSQSTDGTFATQYLKQIASQVQPYSSTTKKKGGVIEGSGEVSATGNVLMAVFLSIIALALV